MPISLPYISSSIPDIQHGISEPIYHQSLSISSSIPSVTMQSIQKIGENTFAAMLFVALVQALVALVQYRTNPKGQLIVPPGLSFGVARPLDLVQEGKLNTSSSTSNESHDTENFSLEKPSLSTETSKYAEIIHRFNRFLFLLIPWASRRIAFLWGRNTHMFHLGFILSINRLFDFPNRWFGKEKDVEIPTASEGFLSIKEKSLGRLIVIGDSLAIGLGSVDAFDSEKDNSVPYMKIENTENDLGPGPVFPRKLAESLSSQSQVPIHWRSAGVDGGDVQLIDDFCFEVIEEEAANGHPPDVVVILCGINDLKYYVSNPFQNAGPQAFRFRLLKLIRKIKEVAPHSKVVLPSFPTQMFHKHSPLNIFPLNLFLDSVVGFWDSQKKLVAAVCPSEIYYFELKPSEVFDWFEFEAKKKGHHESSLIAADGVHPNSKCYSSWAKNLGIKIFSKL